MNTGILQGLDGGLEAGDAVVHHMVVTQGAGFHAGLGEDVHKIRRAAEMIGGIGFHFGVVIVKGALQIDHGEIVLLKILLHLFKGVAVAVLFDIGLKARRPAPLGGVAAQGAVAGEGDHDLRSGTFGDGDGFAKGGQRGAQQRQQKEKGNDSAHKTFSCK